MTGDEIREAYLRFFEGKGHLRIPSSSLIPAGDPTLLLTNAGMVQFKPYFTGEMTPPHTRLTSAQKCFRTTDIDSVGDSTHLTFFEMLGNFSVGDYFKQEAIEYAWEFLREHLGLEPERLWVSVFLDDDEAHDLWVKTGVPATRIRRFGEEDNFWGPAGNEGPCGPCSEINYDFGAEHGCHRPDCGPNCEYVAGDTGLKCDRFVELWNLVFTQYYQAPDGARTPLPAPNIDTGMGLERAAVILQGKRTIYETDLFEALVQRVAELSNRKYGQDSDADYAIRVVAEHARSAAFLISDGVVPGNEGRGYVLRRVIRRAIRYGKKLALEAADSNTGHPVGAIHESPLPVAGRAVLPQVAEVVIDHMKSQYPDLEQRREFVLRVIGLEEERFGEVYERGLGTLSAIADITYEWRGRPEEWPERDADVGYWPQLEQWVDLDITVFQAQPGLYSQLGNWSQILHEEAVRFEEPIVEGPSEIRPHLNYVYQPIRKWRSDAPESANSVGMSTLLSLKAALRETEKRASIIGGPMAFILWDTHGFPPELTQEIAREHGLEVDMEGFEREMEAQRERARAAAGRFGGDFDAVRAYQDLGVGSTPFLGYDTLTASTVVVGLLIDGEQVGQASEGQQVEVVLRETPFYAEMGGQVGDAGEIVGQGSTLHVDDTHSPIAGLTVHRCTVASGSIALGDTVEARVDPRRRQDTARNHTATHMLHAALRQVLGSHVRQHGSLVAPDRLRFDFTHVSPLSQKELREVERLTNEKIRENVAVDSRETTYRQAVSDGALAFFGDRYGDQVRVVEVAPSVASGTLEHPQPFSLEVCGGTHVHRSGDIGLCHIVSETSIGSGLRRIEAVTGRGAEEWLASKSAILEEISRRLQVAEDQVMSHIDGMLAEIEQTTKQAQTWERELLKRQVKELSRKQVAGIDVVSGELTVSAVELLREAGDWLKNDLKSGVAILGTVLEGRPTMLVMGTADMVAQGFHAGNVVKEAAKAMDGGGGGRPDMAQAGGRDPDKLEDALRAAEEEVRRWREKS